MRNWQPATLTWSFSRKREFEECRRQYFYNRFWGQDPRASYRLYEMRGLTTLAMLRGDVAHVVLAEALRAFRSGAAMTVEAAARRVTEIIRQRYMESKRRLWSHEHRPEGRKMNEFTRLLEHYYSFPDTDRRAVEARDVARDSVETAMKSGFWAELTATDPSKWIEIEEGQFSSFDVDGIQVYAKLDFASSGQTPTIIDWKTGRPDGQDRRQLVVYSMYARSKWGWEPERCRLVAAYLHPELDLLEFAPTEDDLEDVRREILASFEQMVELEPVHGPADVEKFPIADTAQNCGWCRFQGICEGAARLPNSSSSSRD